MEAYEEAIIEEFRQVFPATLRPDQFVNREHCEECAEHDDTLRSVDPDTISLKETGNPGWDPMCFINPQGFLYFMPGLARLALDVSFESYYLDTFLFHLDGERVEAMSNRQRDLVHDLLSYLRIRHRGLINNNDDLDDLDKKIRHLSQRKKD